MFIVAKNVSLAHLLKLKLGVNLLLAEEEPFFSLEFFSFLFLPFLSSPSVDNSLSNWQSKNLITFLFIVLSSKNKIVLFIKL